MVSRYYQLFENEELAELYIFGDVVDDAYYENEVGGNALSKEIQSIKSNKINVYINSYGGSVASGLAIYNQLKQHPAHVTTINNGFACSIASVIFMAGDTRLVSESSLLMIHKPWCACSGNANELKIQIEALEKIERASINAYMERINISEEELIELLSNETWLTSDECLNMGFATDVISNNKEEAILQSVKKSLIEIVSQKCKKDKKKHQEVDEDKIIDCPFCDYEGKMPINDDGYFVCPECGRVIKDDQDVIDDDNDDEDEIINDGVNESSTQVINESVNHNDELNVVSSFLNIFK